MKKILIITTYILGFSWTIYGQADCPPNSNPITTENYCEDGKGISTDPDNPLNTECTTMTNDFEWRLKQNKEDEPSPNEEYFTVYAVQNGAEQKIHVKNPFASISNSSSPYYEILAKRYRSDYHPEDGWELVKVEFNAEGNVGLPAIITKNEIEPDKRTHRPSNDLVLPYMILYNKYTGVLRFFGADADPNSDRNIIRIRMTIPKENASPQHNDELKATNLLSIQGHATQPLDQETDEAQMTMLVEAPNNAGIFFWFDLPVAYDPCICNNKVQLDFDFDYINIANIELTGSLNATIKSNSGQSAEMNDFLKTVGIGLNAAVSGVIAVKTGGVILNHKAFTDLIKLVKHPSMTQDQKDKLDQLANYLGCSVPFFDALNSNFKGLSESAAKQAAAGKKILEANTKFLTSLNTGCSSSPSTISGTINATGTVTSITKKASDEFSLAVPGSDWSDKIRGIITIPEPYPSTKTVPAYPTYNERLGTFALLETPTFDYFSGNETCRKFANFSLLPGLWYYWWGVSRSYSFRLASDLKYTFNPLLNIDEDLTEIDGRIVVGKDALYHHPNLHQSKIRGRPPFLGRCVTANQLPLDKRLNMAIDTTNFFMVTSPFVPIDQMKSVPYRFFWQDEIKWSVTSIQALNSVDMHFTEKERGDFMTNRFPVFEDNTYIQFRIKGYSKNIGSDGKPVEFVQYFTFPMKKNERLFDPNHGITRHYMMGQSIFDQDVQFTTPGNIFHEGPVYISAKMSSPNGLMKIYSINGFIIEPGAEIDPSIELIHGAHFTVVPQPPQNNSQIKNFCTNTNLYKAQEHSAAAIAQEKAYYEEQERARILAKMEEDRSFKFGLKPNPTSGMSTVFWDGDEMPNQLTLIDGTGQLLFETPLSGDGRSYDLDMSEYSHGVYFIIITAPSGKKGQQKLIKL